MILKIALLCFDIVWVLWTIWGILIHYSLIEGEQDYHTPFPIIRIAIFLGLFVGTIHIF